MTASIRGSRLLAKAGTAAVTLTLAPTLAGCSTSAESSPTPSDTPTVTPWPSPTLAVPSIPEARVASWTLDVGSETWATPLVVGTALYLGSNDGVFRAIDSSSGRLLWEHATGDEIRGGAATDGTAAFFTSEDGILHSLRLDDGTELWTSRTGDPTPAGARDDWNYAASRPAVVDGVVYTGGFDGTASAVDASTGDILWTFDTEEPIVADIEVGDGLVHVPSTSGIHWALDPATGDKDWAAFVGGAETTSPLVVDGAAILGSRAAVLQAYDAESGDSLWTVPYEGSWVESGAVVIGPDAFVIGSSDIRVVQAFRISDGSLIWSTPVSGAPWAVPVVADGVVYATQISWGPWEPWDASVYALNSHTGEILWSAKTGDALDWTPMDNGGFGIAASPAIAGDYVVVAGLDGVVYAFKR